MSFPINPVIGQKYLNPKGITYEWNGRGWDIYSANFSNYRLIAAEVAPTEPEVTDIWYDIPNETFRMWTYDGADNQWTPFAGDGYTKELLASLLLKNMATEVALPLTWYYDDERFNFELFGDNPDYSFRDIEERRITAGYTNDDSLDLVTTDGLINGQSYVLYSKSQGYLETVKVVTRINTTRVKLESILANAYGGGGINDAYLARTSANVTTRTATFKNGDRLYSKPLNALELWPRGVFSVCRTSGGHGQFKIFYRHPGQVTWYPAPLLETVVFTDGTQRTDRFDVNTTGIIELRIEFESPNNINDTVTHFALFCAPQNNDSNRIQRPTNITPTDQATNVSATPTLTGSAYRSIYGLAQTGARFQVAKDLAFSDLSVNTSTDYLTSWVSQAGQSVDFNDIVPISAKAFYIVGAGGNFKKTTDGAKTFTDLTKLNTKELRGISLNASGQVIVVGIDGTIGVTSNEGVAWATPSNDGGFTGTFYGCAQFSGYALVVGASGQIQRSVNGGVIFNKVTPANTFNGTFRAVTMDGTGRVIMVGTSGEIETSSTYGLSPVKRTPAAGYTGTFFDVAFDSDGGNVAFAVGAGGMVQRSRDAGSSWEVVNLPDSFTGNLNSVYMRGSYIVIAGDSGSIYSSNDGGDSFVKRPAGGGSTSNLFAVAMDGDHYGITVGQGGVVQRTLRLEGAAGTSYTVPSGSDQLQTGKIYFWRVAYQDSAGFWSEWSEPTAFATSSIFNYVVQPQNLSPANGATAIPTQPVLQATAFGYVGAADTHAASHWQVSSSQNFTTPQYDSGEVTGVNNLVKHNVPGTANLVDQQTYFWRVRYKGANDGFGAWSVATQFKVQASPNTPSIISPTNNATNVSPTFTIQLSTFSSSTVGESHVASQYQVASDVNFNNIVHNSGESSSLTSYTIPNGANLQPADYYIRARQKGSATGWSSYSSVNKVSIAKAGVPSITAPANNATGVRTKPTFNGSGFSGVGSETHVASQWQITRNPGVDIDYDTGESTTYKTSYLFTGTLNNSTIYFVRVRYKGSNTGWTDYSNWSRFTTSVPIGEALFLIPGIHAFTVPDGVTQVSAVVIGGGGLRYYGGSGGGGLRFNTVNVTPGQVIYVTVGAQAGYPQPGYPETGVGGTSSFGTYITAYGGKSGSYKPGMGNKGSGGGGVGSLGGNGGDGQDSLMSSGNLISGACGGAGGYTGNGGNAGQAGSGGGGGGGRLAYITGNPEYGGEGGGTGIYGAGASGAAGGSGPYDTKGGHGSNSPRYIPTTLDPSGDGYLDPFNRIVNAFGTAVGDGGGNTPASPLTPDTRHGAVRVIWGPNRTYPNNAGLIL